MLGDRIDRGLGYLVIQGDVKRKKVGDVLDEGDKPRVGQPLAPRQRQALDARADQQGHDAAVFDLLGEGCEVETLDEFAVVEVGRFETKGLADGFVLSPCGAGRFGREGSRQLSNKRE